MRVFLLRSVAAAGVLGLLLAMLSCARDQQLVGISIQPTEETFGSSSTPLSADAGLSVNLRALGHYVHPPVTKDITNQVAWSSDTPGMVTVTSSGVLTPTGLACGNALVSATVQTNGSAGGRSSSGAIITGSMTANVVCPGSSGTDFLLTLDIVGTGTTSSSPAGLGCASNCSNFFPAGTPITINATPTAPATTASFVGCDSGNGTAVCTITALTNNRTVTVTFQ